MSTPSPIKPTFVELMEKADSKTLSSFDRQTALIEAEERLLTWARAGGYEAVQYAAEVLEEDCGRFDASGKLNKLAAILDGKTNEEKL